MTLIRLFFEEYFIATLLTIVTSYCLGSISFSIILTKLFIHKDIRDFGSGNAGATNVLRSVGVWPALLTFVFDFGKQVAAILLGQMFFRLFACPPDANLDILLQYEGYIAGTCCLIGHIYPVFFGFRGGKGVATTAAMMVLIDWRVFLIELAIFLVIMAFTRIVSLGSVICAACYPVATFFVAYFIDYRKFLFPSDVVYNRIYLAVATGFSFLIGMVLIIKHRSNIKRMVEGNEKPIDAKHTK